jgi:hypothetical protein
MLAKIVGGIADGLLASEVREWDTMGLIDGVNVNAGTGAGGLPVRKRVVVATMNTAIWGQLVMARQVKVFVEKWGWLVRRGRGRAIRRSSLSC